MKDIIYFFYKKNIAKNKKVKTENLNLKSSFRLKACIAINSKKNKFFLIS